MTSRQMLGVCIVLSLMVHMLLLQQDWGQEPVVSGEHIVVPLDFDVAVKTQGNALALEQGFVESNPDDSCEDTDKRLRRLALKHYIAQVHEAIDRRKFLPGNGDLSGLIGNALFTFHILPNDSFTDIRLIRSSGDPRLDRAALQAIKAASSMIQRPKILQGQTFTMKTAVKYQYSM
nr:TonB family protein [uncultured Pseudodesulfovibrio sp.]